MLHPVATTGSRRIFLRPIKALPVDGMPIGELSRLCGVHIETIRYYEKIGMLPAPPRSESGRRIYGPGQMRTLVFLRRARELGFGIDDIRALLALAEPGISLARKFGR
jgi:MerR family transcriptional regulator, mercuric resistance operon regulatory protein